MKIFKNVDNISSNFCDGFAVVYCIGALYNIPCKIQPVVDSFPYRNIQEFALILAVHLEINGKCDNFAFLFLNKILLTFVGKEFHFFPVLRKSGKKKDKRKKNSNCQGKNAYSPCQFFTYFYFKSFSQNKHLSFKL